MQAFPLTSRKARTMTAALFGTTLWSAVAGAQSLLVDTQYSRDGRADAAGRNAVEAYLLVALSKLDYGQPQALRAFVRECAIRRRNDNDVSCTPRGAIVRLQIADRGEETQISGSVQESSTDGKAQSHNLSNMRAKSRELTDSLALALKNMDAILATTTAFRREPIRLGAGCFQVESATKDAPASAAHTLAEELPKALNRLTTAGSRLNVAVIPVDSAQGCGRDELRTTATEAKMAAVITGLLSEKSEGVSIAPEIVFPASRRSLGVPAIVVPTDVGAAKALPAISLATTANALFAGPAGELTAALEQGAEKALFVTRSRESLSRSPPDYASTDAMLAIVLAGQPNDPEPFQLLAKSLAGQRRPDEAVNILRAGLGAVSDKTPLYLALADVLTKERDLEGARKVYREGEPVLREEAGLGIARTYVQEGKLSDAMDAAEAAIRQYPASKAARLLAAQIADGRDDLKKAKFHYIEARKLDPGSAELKSRLADLHERQASADREKRNWEAAIAQLTEAIDLFPTLGRYQERADLYVAAYAQTSKRRTAFRRAARDYGAAVALARKDGTTLTQLPWTTPNYVEALVLTGQFKQAKSAAAEFFATMASDVSRPGTDLVELRLITAFLNAVAELLDSGSAEKELYLFENAALGLKTFKSSWSFDLMKTYLKHDYVGEHGAKAKPKINELMRRLEKTLGVG